MKQQNQEYWLTNTCPRNVSLADLNLTIKAYTSVNLLDKKHYQYTLEQLNKSVESGSVYKKRDKIVVRKFAPELFDNNVKINHDEIIPSREKSVLEIKEEKYEELDLSDEKFAAENADLV